MASSAMSECLTVSARRQGAVGVMLMPMSDSGAGAGHAQADGCDEFLVIIIIVTIICEPCMAI